METNTDMLRGRVDIFVLKALSIHDGYGYDILNYIHDKTEGHYEMKQSSIYSVLKRLEKQGYIKSYDGDESNGAKRRYYTLSDEGKKYLQDEEKEWEYTRTLLDNLVSDRTFDLISETPPFRPSDLRPLTRRTATRVEIAEDTSINDDASSVINTNDTVDSVAASVEQVSGTNDQNDELKSDTVVNEERKQVEEIKEEAVVASNPEEKPVLEEKNDQSNQNIGIYDRIALNNNVTPIVTDNGASNYREFFGGLFNSDDDTATNSDDSVDIDCSHINDLRNHLEREGIRLRAYEPTSTRKGLVSYLMVNKLNRDTTLLSFLFLVASLLLVFLYKPFDVSNATFWTLMALSFILPVMSVILWLKDKFKKIKDNVNIKVILSVCGIIYVTFFVISLIINLIVPNGNSLNSLATYAPSIIFLVVPFAGGTYSILYSTKNYHLSSD